MADEKRFANRESLKLPAKRPAMDLFVPELEQWVKIRKMDGKERDEWENSLVDLSGDEPRMNREGQIARLIAMTLADEDGNLIFGMSDIGNAEMIDGAAAYRIFRESFRFNKLGEKGLDDAKKNSDSALGGASSSESQCNGDAAHPNCLNELAPTN